MPTQSPQIRRTTFAPLSLRLALATIIAIAFGVTTHAQTQVIRHERDDGPLFAHDANLIDHPPIWATLDSAIDPKRPDLGQTSILPELMVHELLDALSSHPPALDKAKEAAETLVALAPDRAAAHYNHACVLARRGETDAAFEALDKAVELGWRSPSQLKHMQVDADLDTIRDDGRFAAVVDRIERHIEEERIDPVPLRDEPWQVVAKDLQAQVPALLDRYDVPGVSIAIVRDGRTVWTDSFGVVDMRTDRALPKHALFKVSAPTRLMITLVALQLHEQGVWHLDDPLARWLPDLRFEGDEISGEITIRRALNSTAGLMFDRRQRATFTSVDEEIAQSLAVNPHRVGDAYTWSPEISFLAVGRAIERAMRGPSSDKEPASQELLNYLGTRIRGGVLKPLNMDRTRPRRPTRRFTVASGHTQYGTPYKDIVQPIRPSSPVYTSAGDLARLVELMLSPGSDREFPKLLSPGMIEKIGEPGLAPEDGRDIDFGLGVIIRNTPYGRCFELADTPSAGFAAPARGMGSLIRWYPEANCGVVILFNSDTGMPAARRLAHLALGGI